MNTLYIGSLYEEELTGTQNPPYTTYYTFGGGGKLVGMRRANYPEGNGQLRIVGDWLGSTTLVLDTASSPPSPQVVSRQYYKPYGEVATQSGTSRTSVGYTGQRLDGESGLMFYNARFYDPVLSYFVSADPVAPAKVAPKGRNRYSYVLNNPIRYTDPTGNEAESTPPPPPRRGQCETGNSAIQQECRDKEAELQEYGLIVERLAAWDLRDLELILGAIQDLMAAANWSKGDFRSAMGVSNGIHPSGIYLARESYAVSNGNRQDWDALTTVGDNQRYPTPPVGRYAQITFYDQAFKDSVGVEPGLRAKVAPVHELAHVWDHAQMNDYSTGMANRTNSYQNGSVVHATLRVLVKHGRVGGAAHSGATSAVWAAPSERR